MRTFVAAALGLMLAVADVGPSGRVMALPKTPSPLDVTRPSPSYPLGNDPVVLVVLDGVRWQEIFEGIDPDLARGSPLVTRDAATLTPNLHALMSRGVSVGGTERGRMRASGPNFVSLPSYREILSGRDAAPCRDNDCPRVTEPTIVDELRDRGRKTAVFSSWEKIDLAAARNPEGIVMSTGRGDDPGSPWPGTGAFRQDRTTADLALEYLESERPDFLFLGLGETDEYAHHGNYLGYVSALTLADNVIGQLEGTLARMGERGKRTHVFVTTDHGRSQGFRDHGGNAPESARVWLAAAGPRILARGAIEDGDRRLRDIAPTIRVIAGVAKHDAAPDSGVVMDALLTPPSVR